MAFTKKLLFIVIVFSFVLSLGFPVVKANSGPPANIQINIINYGNVEFSLDLLIYKEVAPTENEINLAKDKILNQDNPFEYSLFDEEYAEYRDSEGYVSNSLYGSSDYFYFHQNDTNHTSFVQLWMDIPREFKILLYTSDGIIITSDLIIMEQYDYRLTYDLEGVDLSFNQTNVGVISGFNGKPWLNVTTWFNFLLRLILTLAIELGLLYLFNFRKKWTFLIILGMNIISQVILNIVLISVYYTSFDNGYAFPVTLIIGEFFVFLGEALFVSILIKEHKLGRRIGYSLVANTLSLVIGLLLASWLSFII